MAFKEDLETMLIEDKKKLEEITEKLNSLTQEDTKLKKSIESVEHLLSHKFGLEFSKTRVIRISEKSKVAKVTDKIDELEIAYKSIPDAALEIMLETENKPLHVKEIYQRLIEKGKQIKNPSSVGVGLSRDKRFKRLGKNVFVIIEEH